MFGIVANILTGLLSSVYGITRAGTTAIINGTIVALRAGSAVQVQDTNGTARVQFDPSNGNVTTVGSYYMGTSVGGGDAGIGRIAAGVIKEATNGWIQNTAGRARVTTQFDKVNATLANVTGLSVTLIAGRTYKFIASLPVTADAVGGYKVAMAGTVTATTVYYDVVVEANGIAPSLTRLAALAGTASGTLGTTVRVWIEGVITVNAGGTLTVQFAQSAANGTSSVLVGADLTVEDVP